MDVGTDIDSSINIISETVWKSRVLAKVSAMAVALSAMVTLLLWFMVTSWMSSQRLDHTVGSPHMVLFMFIMSSGLFLFLSWPRKKGVRYAASAAAALTIVFTAVVLIQYATGAAGGLYSLLPASAADINGAPANSVSPNTAATMMVMAIALLLFSIRPGAGGYERAAVILASLSGLNSFVVGVTYLFGAPLQDNSKIVPMSLAFAAFGLLMAIALVAAAGPGYWPMRLFTGAGLRARLMRVFLPLTMVIVLMEGVFIHRTYHRFESFNPALVSSIMVLIFVTAAGLLVSKLAQVIGDSVDRDQKRRQVAERDLKRSEERLRQLFESSPVSLWEGDLSQVREYVDNLKLRGVEDLDSYLKENEEEMLRCVSMVRVLSVNEATLAMYEAEDAARLASGMAQVFIGRSLDAFRSVLLAIINDGVTELEVEAETRTLEGRRMDSVIRLNVVPGYEQTLGRVLISITDVTELKKKEEELILKARQLEASQRVAGLGSWEWDIAAGSVTWSDELYRLFGVDPESFEPTYENVLAMVHPDDRQMMDRAYRKAMADSSAYHFTARVLRPEGVEWVMEAIGEFTCDEEGKLVRGGGTAQDITGKREAERALRLTQLSVDRSADAMFWMDEEGGFFYVNESACRSLGYSREELLEMTVFDIDPNFQREVWPERWQEVQNRGSFQLESVHRRKNGDTFPVEITANYIEFEGKAYNCAIARDLTERNRVEAELRSSEQRFRGLFEQATDGIFLISADTAEIVDVNTFGAERLGYDREEMIGMKVTEINPPEEPPAIRERMERQKAGETITFETSHQRRDGSWMPVEITSRLVSYGGGQLLQAIVRDITERKQAEAELRASEEKFRTIVTNSQPIIFMIDRNGVFQLSEGESLSSLGLRPGQVVGMSAFEMYADFPEIIAGIESALGGVASRGIIDINGVKFDIFYSPLFDGEGEVAGLMGMAVDITEREEAKHEIERSARYYDKIFSSIKDGISILDKDMVIQSVNNTMEEWFSFRLPLEGKKCYEVYHGRSEPCEICPVKQTLETAEPAYRVVPKRNEAGEVTGWFDLYSFPLLDEETGHLENVIEYVRDISQQQQALEDLRRSEENYRALFEESPLALAIHRDGVVIDANQAAVRLVGGASREELIGTNVIEYVHPDYRQLAVERMKAVLEGEGRAPGTEEKFIRLDDSVIDVEVSAMAVQYEGEPAVQVAIQDISERRQLEEQLRQAQKMESVGTMAGGIAHDFNNFLTAIEGYIDLSLMDIPEDSPVRAELTEARRSADRAANLTRQLLLFSRREPMDLRPTDISRVVADMQNMLSRLLGERFTLKIGLKKSVWTVKADAGHLEQVIMNLVVNARDAMPEGGEIRIGTENIEIDADYVAEHAEAEPGKYVCLIVADEGEGMDPKTQSHIFDPFFSTKEGREGTGLGLSVVYGIVSQHGGWIDVDSSPGRGTIFRIFIPALPLEQELERPGMEMEQELNGHGERVLLVEDEDAVRALANRLLSEHGYRVYAAATAEEAGRIFQREQGQFDLLFSDVVLPGEDGVSLVSRLKNEHPGLRVLLASGYSGEETNRLQIEEEGINFIQKPYSLKGLMGAVRDMMKE